MDLPNNGGERTLTEHYYQQIKRPIPVMDYSQSNFWPKDPIGNLKKLRLSSRLLVAVYKPIVRPYC